MTIEDLNNVYDFESITSGTIKGCSHFKLEIEFKLFESGWLQLPSVTLPPCILRGADIRATTGFLKTVSPSTIELSEDSVRLEGDFETRLRVVLDFTDFQFSCRWSPSTRRRR
jgi:hypothetical protein